MDELKSLAAKSGLSDGDLADLAVGGYLSVLKHSEHLEAGVLDGILAHLGKDATINLKQYEKNAGHGHALGLPKLEMPWGKKKDKDAENTKACVDFLSEQFEGYSQENLVKFMKAFIEYIQYEVTEAVDIDTVLKMPN